MNRKLSSVFSLLYAAVASLSAPGYSRDIDVSIEKFLGRKRSLEPFLEKLGIGKNAQARNVAKKPAETHVQ